MFEMNYYKLIHITTIAFGDRKELRLLIRARLPRDNRNIK